MHLTDIRTLDAQQIMNIFETADRIAVGRGGPLLAGKCFLLFFPDTSLRTRLTFERGIQELGGSCVLFPPQTLDKQEDLQDVARYAANWADGLVIRHPDDHKLRLLAGHSPIPVINAMSANHHPCEVLSDLYAIRKMREHYKELAYTFVGPPGNVFNSWMEACQVLGLRFNHVCVPDYELGSPGAGYHFYTGLEEALAKSDVIMTDALPSGLRTPEYIDKYQITVPKLRNSARLHALVNPCPPFTRGLEIHEDILASPYFVGYGFKQSLLCVQQAILLHCLLN
ncbi:ornithine carbamoyltransferase [Paenibacillus tepidiphilus]|uniref:ornithine carbamoyltransferase n=1 Tax=Paenibacillus tepidiphilus TaxID=2608683 RepID=UPI00123BA5D1|nr:ornithine carbamoyltransferase [Paenibacillus tepidiphilus]